MCEYKFIICICDKFKYCERNICMNVKIIHQNFFCNIFRFTVSYTVSHNTV